MSEPRITAVEFKLSATSEQLNQIVGTSGGQMEAHATFDDGSTGVVLTYFTDELTFAAEELVGLTAVEVRWLHFEKDKEWLRT